MRRGREGSLTGIDRCRCPWCNRQQCLPVAAAPHDRALRQTLFALASERTGRLMAHDDLDEPTADPVSIGVFNIGLFAS